MESFYRGKKKCKATYSSSHSSFSGHATQAAICGLEWGSRAGISVNLAMKYLFCNMQIGHQFHEPAYSAIKKEGIQKVTKWMGAPSSLEPAMPAFHFKICSEILELCILRAMLLLFAQANHQRLKPEVHYR